MVLSKENLEYAPLGAQQSHNKDVVQSLKIIEVPERITQSFRKMLIN